MARRHRIDIFLILYLTAIVGFAVVSREREFADKERTSRYEQLLATFIPRLPVRPERDTIRWYVSADDNSGLVTLTEQHFEAKIFVHDIDPDDQVTMTVHSIILDSLLTVPDLLKIGDRTGYGEPHERVVYFPLCGEFPRTGVYTINLQARSDRIRRLGQGMIEYRGIQFDTTSIPSHLVSSLESSVASLTVLVIDTSIEKPKTLEPLLIQAQRERISSAIGFEEQNLIRVNLAWSEPTVTVVRGGGRLVQATRSDKLLEYRWVGTVTGFADTVVVEARLRREAGGKDISRTQFVVSGVTPYLLEQLPRTLYAGEEFSINMRVQGLDQPDLYRWSLFEEAGQNDLLLKASGSGPVVTYRIPTSYAGKRMVIETLYEGRKYRFLSLKKHVSGPSRLSRMVETPPTQIVAIVPQRAPANAAFRFSASRYSQPRFMGEQPVDKISDVSVEMEGADGRDLEVGVSMIRKGEFEFELMNIGEIARGGERVAITIRAGDALFLHSMILLR